MNKFRLFVSALFSVWLLTACGGKQQTTKPVYDQAAANRGDTCTAGSKSKYGNPKQYKVFGKRYEILPTACGFTEMGIASWYGPNFHGKRTSSGETYDMHAMTGAHKTLPIPVMLRVINLENNRHVVIRVNDRGPFHDGRVVDLSKEAAKRLGVLANGTAQVRIEVVDSPSQRVPRQPVVRDYRDAVYVQVASFSELKNAQNMQSRLVVDGFENANVYSFNVSGRNVYRVRVGPFSNRLQAQNTSSLLNKMGYRNHKVMTD